MGLSRNATGTLFVGGALAVTLAALAYPSMLGVQNVSTSTSRVIANTSSGPLTEADRDFVVKVRAAGLWELPVGILGMNKGTTEAVRIAGEHLVDGHARLDEADRKVATALGITIPNKASPQQEGFVSTLTSESGKQFDTDFATILRTTHGSIFNTIASIRSTTQNTQILALANQANATVLDHITVMEKTGLVNMQQVLFQETSPPKLPKSDTTPPVPAAGEPTIALTPPAGFTAPPTVPPDTPGAGTGTTTGDDTGAEPSVTPSPSVG
ncbi:protein of unknown function DUF4142 [Actinobacteria bacterium OK074]|nr:protein of unknown function DUF4142 [Actinobacteria bacterium OK074]